jgi:hypothetical protein
MAKVYITEFTAIDLNVSREPPLAEQTVAIGGGSVQCSNAFHAMTRAIRVHTDAICSVAISRDPTATANTRRMAANTTEYFGAEGGQKIAVITNT